MICSHTIIHRHLRTHHCIAASPPSRTQQSTAINFVLIVEQYENEMESDKMKNDFANWNVSFLHAHPSVPAINLDNRHSNFSDERKERKKKWSENMLNKGEKTNINLFSAMISANCQLLSLHINRSVHIFYFIPFAHVILIFHPHSGSVFLRKIIFLSLNCFVLHCGARDHRCRH